MGAEKGLQPHLRQICTAIFLFILVVPAAIFIRVAGGPKVLLFLVEPFNTVDGIAAGCNAGEDFRYTYSVDGEAFAFRPGLSSPCKVAIPAGRKLAIHYLASDPSTSWASSNPRQEIATILALCFLAALLGTAWTYFGITWRTNHSSP